MSKNDAVIKELMGKVEEQKKELGKKPRGVWVTNGVFKFKSGREFFNINTVTDFTLLAQALGILIEQEESFNEACKRLDVSGKFEWDGYPVSDWEEDFKMRISMVKWADNKKKLDATKRKLDSLVSEEARTEMELDEIKKSLA